MGTFINNINRFFRQRSVLSNLIVINIAVFLLIKTVGILGFLFNLDSGFLVRWLELPSGFRAMAVHAWTLVTYAFTHTDFWHILFNLLWLYWFGKIFLLFFDSRQLGGIYVLGSLLGGILFLLSYNLLPYFRENNIHGFLIGASAAVMAIVFAAAFYRKDYEINLLFVGSVKIIYLAFICLIIGILISTKSDDHGRITHFSNAGGHIAHIGGALAGIWFALSIRKGKDITRWINWILDKASNLFKKKPSRMKVKYKRFESDYDYNARKNAQSEDIDHILDKIKRSGYSSLTNDEKKKLFDASNR